MPALLVRKAWKRIENWYGTHEPKALRDLNRGASKKEIRTLEAAIQRVLPEDVRTSLSIHNGQTKASANSPFLFGNLLLMSCVEIARWHTGSGSSLCETPAEERDFRFYPPGAIAHHRFNGGWVPIADALDGDYLAVDHAPGPSGTVGQIIDFGNNITNPGVIASSWGEYLHSYADLLDVLIEIKPAPEYCFEPLHKMCESSCLDRLVLWARDGWWPIVRFAPAWRTPTVTGLAKNIQETHDFSAMPILADALQDAGCEAAAVLNHCRDRECRHSYGCWVINTLLSAPLTEQLNCHKLFRR